MSFIRDFFRRRRLRRHVARHGWRFDFHGREVVLPELSNPGFASALLRGKYEREEAELIGRHLPAHVPVIELGGSLGIVSGLIRSRLDAATPHVVLEANPDIIDICRRNAGDDPAVTTVVNGALAYDAPKVRFPVGGNIHANRLGAAENGRVAEVEAFTLAALWHRLGSPSGFSLVSDVEGAELDIVRREPEVVAKAGLVVMELHPAAYPQGRQDEAALLTAMDGMGFELLERLGDVCAWRRRQ